MEESVKENLLAAIRFMMKPLVRLLINQGVTYRAFAETIKEVYVENVIRHVDQGQRVNKSRIAVLTGLTRKEVKNVLDRAIADPASSMVPSRPERVLTGWYTDPYFTGPYGLPLELPYEAEEDNRPDFIQLVRTFSGDMSPRAMLTELERGGSVTVNDGLIRPIRRDFQPSALSSEMIIRLGEVGYKVFLTAAANVEKTTEGKTYFDRLVYAEKGCSYPVIEKFDSYIKERGQQFLENLDSWLTTHDEENAPNDERLATGVYLVHYVESVDERSTLGELLVSMGKQGNENNKLP